jgi:hypothetical protein
MTSPLVVARAESPKQPRSSGVLLRLLRKRDYELAVTCQKVTVTLFFVTARSEATKRSRELASQTRLRARNDS